MPDRCPCGNDLDFGMSPLVSVPQGCRVVDIRIRVLCDECGALLVKEMSPRDKEPERA